MCMSGEFSQIAISSMSVPSSRWSKTSTKASSPSSRACYLLLLRACAAANLRANNVDTNKNFVPCSATLIDNFFFLKFIHLWQVHRRCRHKYIRANRPCVCLTVACPTNWLGRVAGSLFNSLVHEFRNCWYAILLPKLLDNIYIGF